MKKTNKCCLLLLIGCFQINTALAAQDCSKMSKVELDAAFILAVKEHRLENIEELIKDGADVNALIPYTTTSGDCDWMVESTALTYAVTKNCPDIVKVLVKVENNLNEALDLAIKKGYANVVEELIKGGADINYVNKDKDTPLIIAVKNARATSEFSLQAQARVASGWYERRKIIDMLLEKGADVTHVNKYGRTALMEAVIEHDLNTVKSLLKVPAMTTGSYFGFGTKPINYADQDDNTALILALKNVRYNYINNQEYKICINSQKIINELLETLGIDLYHVNNNGETAIMLIEKLNEEMNRYSY